VSDLRNRSAACGIGLCFFSSCQRGKVTFAAHAFSDQACASSHLVCLPQGALRQLLPTLGSETGMLSGRRGYAPELELVAEDDSAGSGFGRRMTSGSRRPIRNLRAAA
jgi:hypothetical protein